MEYTVQKFSRLAGVSPRTLRYYDEIDLLKPARISSAGYRIYGLEQVDRLQLILFYRALDFKLEEIQVILETPGFDRKQALVAQRGVLLEKRRQLDQLIDTVEKTIVAAEGRSTMSDQEKFEDLKKMRIAENEEKYGKEIRQRYGEEMIDSANAKILNMNLEEHKKLEALSQAVLDTLEQAFEAGDPGGELAQKAADLHRQWLCCYWQEYTSEAHGNMVDMYLADSRFTAYYDAVKPGLTAFLREAVSIYIGR